MVSVSVDCFDLKRICDCGQIFRMYERADGVFDVYSGSRHIRVRQRKKGERNTVDFVCTQEEFDSYWKRYFDLDRDYGAIVKEAMRSEKIGTKHEDNAPDTKCEGYDSDIAGETDKSSTKYENEEFVATACRFGAGIRILHQDIWEMLISFIISQQKQIPSIRKCIEALCERFGERRCEKIPAFDDTGSDGQPTREEVLEDHLWYTFPTAWAIAEGGAEGLKGLSLGYRERYIYETAVRYLSEGRPYEEVESIGLEAASAYFKSFCGVGEKVANCICLFGAGYVDAFPIDTHIKDILYREYYLKDDSCIIKEQAKLTQSDYEELVKFHFDRFKGYRGIVQQWIFAWELVRGKNETHFNRNQGETRC